MKFPKLNSCSCRITLTSQDHEKCCGVQDSLLIQNIYYMQHSSFALLIEWKIGHLSWIIWFCRSLLLLWIYFHFQASETIIHTACWINPTNVEEQKKLIGSPSKMWRTYIWRIFRSGSQPSRLCRRRIRKLFEK